MCPKECAARLQDMMETMRMLPSAPEQVEALEMGRLAVLGIYEQRPQRQDSLSDQLRTLVALANLNGLYDAAEYVERTLAP